MEGNDVVMGSTYFSAFGIQPEISRAWDYSRLVSITYIMERLLYYYNALPIDQIGHITRYCIHASFDRSGFNLEN